jgi:hypothetical protein
VSRGFYLPPIHQSNVVKAVKEGVLFDKYSCFTRNYYTHAEVSNSVGTFSVLSRLLNRRKHYETAKMVVDNRIRRSCFNIRPERL